jgi:hypothetical protein
VVSSVSAEHTASVTRQYCYHLQITRRHVTLDHRLNVASSSVQTPQHVAQLSEAKFIIN